MQKLGGKKKRLLEMKKLKFENNGKFFEQGIQKNMV